MTEPLTDEEFDLIKDADFCDVREHGWKRLIATVESLKKEEERLQNFNTRLNDQVCEVVDRLNRREEENLKLKDQLDAALKQIEERREDDQIRNG